MPSLPVFNETATANQYTFLGIMQGANNATSGLLFLIFIIVLYFIVFVTMKTATQSFKNAILATSSIMSFIVIMFFWISLISQSVFTMSIIFLALSIIISIWME